jgi:hypothetical protein
MPGVVGLPRLRDIEWGHHIKEGTMHIRRSSMAAVCAVPLLAPAFAGAPLTASAAGPEVDSAVISVNFAAGTASCSFASSAEGTGQCTVGSTIFPWVTCSTIEQLVRQGTLSLVEPSGESVALSFVVTGGNSSGVFAGSGSDGGKAVTAAGAADITCGRFGSSTSGTITVAWTAA